MVHFYVICLLILNGCWLGLVFFALPGNWLIVVSTALFAWWRWEDGVFSIYTLIAISVLATVGEIVEFFAGVGGAKKAGAGWRGAFAAVGGAIVGAVFGTFFIPVPFLGTLFGACLGAGLGTMAVERWAGKEMHASVRSGFGAGLGVFIGTGSKFLIGVLIWIIVAVAGFVS